jgi:hypothetical protein
MIHELADTGNIGADDFGVPFYSACDLTAT